MTRHSLARKKKRRLRGVLEGKLHDSNSLTVMTAVDTDSRFDRIFREEVKFVRRTVCKFGVPKDDIEDAVQEIFLVCFRHRHKLEQESALRPWLSTIARYVCRNHRRAWWRSNMHQVDISSRVEPEVVPDSRVPSPDEAVARDEARRLLEQLLAQLSPPHRIALILTEVGQMTAAEIGTRMQASPNTVASWVRRARRQCQRALISTDLPL